MADRGNRRIQVFDPDGKFLRADQDRCAGAADAKPWMGNKPEPGAGMRHDAPGAPWTVCITPGPTQYIYTSDAFPGRIYKLTLDGKIGGRARQGRAAAEAVRMDSRDRVPVGK